MIDVLRAEWLKARSVRSTLVILAVLTAAVALIALLAVQVAALWDHAGADQRQHFAVSSLSELTSWLAQLCLAVFGVLTITSEYHTGLIRSTFTAVPARQVVLAAKAVLVAVVGFGAGEAAVLVTAVVTRAVLGDRPIPGQPGAVAGQLPLLLADGLTVAVFALLGLGLGGLTRSAVAAIATVAALWYLVPIVVAHLPAPWSSRIGSVSPGALPGELAGTGNPDSVYGHLLPPWAALLALLAYALVPVAAAAVVIGRRDA